MLLGFNTPDLSISNPCVEIIQSEKDNVFYAVYSKANEEIKADTLCAYGYAIKLQEYHIDEDSTISLIIESRFGTITYVVFFN